MKGSTKIILAVVSALIALTAVCFLPQIIDATYSLAGPAFMQTTFNKEALLSYYGNVLVFLGTTLLGLFALSQTKRANKLSETVTKMQIADRKAFLIIDISKHLNVFLENKDPLFFSNLNSGNLLLYPAYTKNDTESNLILFEFFVKNTSSSYIKSIALDKFSLFPEFDGAPAVALDCDYDTNSLLAPGESRKAVAVISGLQPHLMEQSIVDFLSGSFSIEMAFTVTNLQSEKTAIQFALYANYKSFNKKDCIKTFEISYEKFNVAE